MGEKLAVTEKLEKLLEGSENISVTNVSRYTRRHVPFLLSVDIVLGVVAW